ncbi:MAG: YrzE family protein [Clostridia bacterium]|nr:YrzE family protein [Clostridia bacterium]
MKRRKEAKKLKSRGFSPNLHYLKYVAGRYSWLALISLAVMGMHTIFDSISAYGNPIIGDSIRYFSFVGISAETELTIFYASAIVAILFAIVLFGFLWKKKEAYFTLSLGVSLKSQFLIRYLFGAGLLLVTYVLCFAASYAINITRLGGDTIGLCGLYAFNYTLMFCTIAIAVYTLTVLALTLSGRFIECILSVASLLAAPYSIGYLLKYIFLNFLHGSILAHDPMGEYTFWADTNVFKSVTEYADSFGAFTAFKDFFNVFRIPTNGDKVYFTDEYLASIREEISLPVAGFLITLAILSLTALAAYFCFTRRPAESAKKAGIYPIFYVISAILASVGAALPVFLIPGNRFLILLLYCAAFALVFFILSAVYNANIKAFFIHYKSALASLACVCLCVLICFFGGFGYSGYLPDAEDVECVYMDYIGNPVVIRDNWSPGVVMTVGGLMDYYDVHGNVVAVDVNNAAKSYTRLQWKTSIGTLPQLRSIADIEKAIEIHEFIINENKQTRGNCIYDPDDPSASAIEAGWHIVYLMKDGTMVDRYYPYVTLRGAEKIASIEESEAYRNYYLDVRLNHKEASDNCYDMSKVTFEIGDEFFSDIVTLDHLSVDEKYELLEALSLDFAALSYEERYFSAAPVLGIVRFAFENEDNSGTSFMTTGGRTPEDKRCDTWYITEKYTRTLEYLEKMELLYAFDGKITVTKVEVQELHPYLYGQNPTGLGALLIIQSYDNLVHTVNGVPVSEIPETEWESYITRSRAITAATRGGTLVRITYTNSAGQSKIIDRLIPNE